VVDGDVLGKLRAIATLGTSLLEGVGDERDRDCPSVALHFHGWNVSLEHEGNHLIAQASSYAAEP